MHIFKGLVICSADYANFRSIFLLTLFSTWRRRTFPWYPMNILLITSRLIAQSPISLKYFISPQTFRIFYSCNSIHFLWPPNTASTQRSTAINWINSVHGINVHTEVKNRKNIFVWLKFQAWSQTVKTKYKPTAARTTPELCERARKSEKGGTKKYIVWPYIAGENDP